MTEDESVTARVDCQFCGARDERTLPDVTALRAFALAWYRKHKPCAGGTPIKATIWTGEGPRPKS